jgi:hypothetical protein
MFQIIKYKYLFLLKDVLIWMHSTESLEYIKLVFPMESNVYIFSAVE